jgi:hypothetical protein
MSKSRGYTREQLDEFIRRHGTKWNNGEPPDKDLCHAAACALQDYLYFATDLRKEFELAKKRGQRRQQKKGRQVSIDIDKAGPGDKVYQLALRRVAGALSESEFCDLVSKHYRVGKRQAQRWYAQIKPRVAGYARFLELALVRPSVKK